MKKLKLFILGAFIFTSIGASAQEVIKQISKITGTDTCCVNTHIGEIYYFGKNSKKARLYPHYSCIVGENTDCEILWVPSKRWRKRSKVTEEQFIDYVYGADDSKFSKCPCFAFFQKYKVNKFPDGGIIYEPIFPTVIEVYSWESNEWVKLFERGVESSKELGLLQLELVR